MKERLHLEQISEALIAAHEAWFWCLELALAEEGELVELYGTKPLAGKCRATALDGTGQDADKIPERG